MYVSLLEDMRGRSPAIFYVCEETTIYIFVFINSMKRKIPKHQQIIIWFLSFGFKD